MKVSNILIVTMLIGGLIVLTSGKEKVESYTSFSEETKTGTIQEKELNKEIDELVKEELESMISFEDVFDVTKEELIEPNDICDIEQEEEIVLDVKVKAYLPQDFNPYSS